MAQVMRVGPLELDGLLDPVSRPAPERLEVVGVLRRTVEVRVGHLVRARDERLEVLLRVRDPGDRQRALRRAVVGDGAADHLVLEGLPDELEILLGDFPRRLDRLAATGREEDPVQLARRVGDQPLGQLDGLGVRVRPQREERQLGGLLGRSIGELRATVPELHREQPGQPVQVATALVVEDVRTVAAHDHRDVALAVLVA